MFSCKVSKYCQPNFSIDKLEVSPWFCQVLCFYYFLKYLARKNVLLTFLENYFQSIGGFKRLVVNKKSFLLVSCRFLFMSQAKQRSSLGSRGKNL